MYGGYVLKHKNIIERRYDIQIKSMQEIQGGWSALAYRVIAENGVFFLKAYEKHKHTAKAWINKIDEYMPVVMTLRENKKLCGRIVVPVLTVDSKYKIEDDDYVFILFPFINGSTPGNDNLTEDEQICLAEIIAELHMYKESDFQSYKNKEDFNTGICVKLSQLITQGCFQDTGLHDVFTQYSECLLDNIAEMNRLAKKLSCEKLEFVLCHTDLHGWNVLQAEPLVLLDWEGLKIAPAEADLFSFSEGFFFDYAWKTFLEFYQKDRPDYIINQDALTFYRLRRRLEDILEFAESVLFDELTMDERNISIDYLKKECIALQKNS